MNSAAERYRGVTALVLGGSGFIGRWTARALDAAAADTVLAVRHPGGDMPGRSVVVDLTTAGAIERLVADVRPAIVFNLAGYGVDAAERDAGLMETLNARIVEDLCAALPRVARGGWAGAHLVSAGSALEYGRTRGPLREDAPELPDTEYGLAKLRASRAIASAPGLRGISARLFTVYGPGEHEHRLLPSLIRTARTGESLPLTAGRQPRDFTYVEDVVEGLLRLGAAAAPAGAVVNLATGHLTTVRVFAETAARIMEIDPERLLFGALPERGEEMWHGEVDISRLTSWTGWRPAFPVEAGIRRTWELSV